MLLGQITHHTVTSDFMVCSENTSSTCMQLGNPLGAYIIFYMLVID